MTTINNFTKSASGATSATVQMSAAEAEQFEAFKKYQQAEAEKLRQQEERKVYKQLVDDTIAAMFPQLQAVSGALAKIKTDTTAAFRDALDLKAQIFEVKPDQRSNMFTHTDGTRRIILGEYEIDNWDDTVNEGVAKVKAYIGSLARDAESQMLVNGILKLLSKDKEGNLKASRVMQLRKMADESCNEIFIDGVRIIEAAHRPAVSKSYIRVEFKNAAGAWETLPLGITEA